MSDAPKPPPPPAAAPAAPAAAETAPAPAPPTLADRLGVAGAVVRAERDGIATVVVGADSFAVAAAAVRGLGFVRFVDLCVVDLVESGRADRFEVQLLTYSMTEQRHARIKAYTAEHIPSVTSVFEAAHNYEREAFDLYGVVFTGHPALTRLLLPDGWVGHPMRRDAVQPFEPVDFTVTRDLYNT